MYTNVNLAAPIGALLFLGTAFVLAILLLVLIFGAVRWRPRLIVPTAIVIGVVVSAYFVVMLIFSASSTENILARGEEKHFCELDCHLAYSISDVKILDSYKVAGRDLRANGVFYLVTLRTHFDESTISPNRGNGPLTPNPRSISIVDATGHRYVPSSQIVSGLESNNGQGIPLTTALRPGESYETVFGFDLPKNVQNPTLQIGESDWVTHLIIGHENSFAHKKTTLHL